MPPSTRQQSVRGPRRFTFDGDPLRLIRDASLGSAASFGDLTPAAGPLPVHAFRLLRPLDLVALDIVSYGLDFADDADGPALIPGGANGRLEVRLPFQHLGEQAWYALENATVPATTDGTVPGSGPPPDAPVEPGDTFPAGTEPPAVPPNHARAALGSRLVYAVPAGERIAYSVEGVLAAMSRLPLLVAPLATPRPPSASPPFSRRGDFVLLELPGGLQLVRATAGLVLRDATRRGAPVPTRTLDRVISGASSLRAARAMLAMESAVNRSRTEISRFIDEVGDGGRSGREGFGDLVLRPEGPIRRRRPARPRAPLPGETAIEAPYRLIVSPSSAGGFAHANTPQGAPTDATRVELWHSRLGVRNVGNGVVRIEERADPQRVIRAIWARDKEGIEPTEPDNLPFRMSLNGLDRVMLVRQSADPLITTPLPIDVERLYLTSLGAWLDLHGSWDIEPYASADPPLPSIISWDHEAPMGRDQFVRVVYPGYFFFTGHRCALVKVTERKIKEAGNPQARLYQRKFLVVSQPVMTYDDRRMPFKQITLRPLVTPDIRDPTDPATPHEILKDFLFWPVVEGSTKFRFTLDCIDHDDRRVRLQAPLLFVAAHLGGTAAEIAQIVNAYNNAPDRPIAADGQSIAFAKSGMPGDAAMETVSLRFTGAPGAPGTLTDTPWLEDADIVIPAMRHLAPASPQTRIKYAQTYLDLGFGGKNAEPQVFLSLDNPASISFGTGTDKAGGFIQPDLPVRGLSRALGAVGDIDDLVNKPPAQRFNPTKFLAGALPKLFGLFDLVDILNVVGLDKAPSFITEQLDIVAGMLADLEALQSAVERSADRLQEDAADAATTALRDQAEQARARIDAVRAQLQTRVAELVDALDDLLALDTPSSPADVTAAVIGAMTALGAQVTELGAVIRELPLPPPVKAELERLVNVLDPLLRDLTAIARTIETITSFVNGLDPEGLSVRARFEWRPELKNFPDVADDKALFVVRKDGLLLSVEARASGADGVGTDILAELRGFHLNLFPGAPLMRLGFDRIAFRASSGRKPEVDVVFTGIEFVGVLSFIETLKELIPFDGFADPPYLDVSSDGVTAGFDVALPNVAVGVFSLENISLGADTRVPFLGEAVTVGFYFCTREKPFRLTVMMIGGGGFVGIRLSPKGMVLLEMALEAGASLSVNLGVASGSVSVMVGVYLRLEAKAGSLTGYFRIRGEVDVLGLISASITLELSLTYEFETGKMVGRASISIEVEVFLLSFSVSVSCERRLAGSNGDPLFAEIMGVQADGSSPAWVAYCHAFAEP